MENNKILIYCFVYMIFTRFCFAVSEVVYFFLLFADGVYWHWECRSLDVVTWWIITKYFVHSVTLKYNLFVIFFGKRDYKASFGKVVCFPSLLHFIVKVGIFNKFSERVTMGWVACLPNTHRPQLCFSLFQKELHSESINLWFSELFFDTQRRQWHCVSSGA